MGKNGNNRNNRSNRNGNHRGGRRDNSKVKKIEVNVPDSDINAADTKPFMLKSKDNDASWYTRIPSLVRDAANFTFSWPLGNQMQFTMQPLQNGSVSSNTIASTFTSVPGIMEIDYFPTIGRADGSTAPVNYAAQLLYAFVRYANSGSANYDPVDLMQYILAMKEAFTYYAYLTRIYGLARHAQLENRYYPATVLTALGCNIENVTLNLAQLRYYINMFAERLSAFAVPADMALIARQMWLCSGIYKDSDNNKAQSYIFKPTHFYLWTHLTTDDGELTPTKIPQSGSGPLGSTYSTVNDLIQFGQSILNPLLAEEDFGIMTGDIIKAFGRNNLLPVAPIAEDYIVIPSYSQEVLSQIENLTICGTIVDNAQNIKITVHNEVGNTYLQQQLITAGFADDAKFSIGGAMLTKLLNMHMQSPSPDDVMVATRLISFYGGKTAGSNNIYDVYGTEIVESIKVWELVNYVNTVGTIPTPIVTFNQPAIITSQSQYVAAFPMFTQFDWNPIIPVGEGGADPGTSAQPFFTLNGFLGDIDNYAMLSKQDVRRLHEVAVLSMFQVPTIASLSKNPYQA